MSRPATVLVVDDQEPARRLLCRQLEKLGHDTAYAESVMGALEILRQRAVDLVVTDLRMPEHDGIAGLKMFRELDPGVPVVLLTAHGTVETAVQAMKLGAFDYLRKPFEPEEMEIVVARALAHRRLVEENRKLRAEVAEHYRVENIVGSGPAISAVVELARKVARADAPVLITGESGTGKDLVARAIYGMSRRSSGVFLSINCAAVPENLLESQLFGHEKGAFSGAERARSGYFREADGGTLFLDEIGEMSLAQQAKLLRVLESGEMIPVGSERPVQVDVRVIAATNRDPETLVVEGRFREDLLFRIDTVRIELPPLRARREDIPALVAHFLEGAAPAGGRVAPRMGAETMRVLMAYGWPGNVRELAHALQHAVLVAEGERIEPGDLPARVRDSAAGGASLDSAGWAAGSFRDARAAFEREYFTRLVEGSGGNVSAAASQAGIHRATLYEKLKRLGIDLPEGDR